MHVLFIALVPKDKAKTPEKAIEYAMNGLEEEGFCSNNSYYASGKGDWFVAGGRWSGLLPYLKGKLSKKKWDKEFEDDVRDGCNSKPDDAMILTPTLREALRKHDGDIEVGVFGEWYEETTTKALTKDHDGMWAVVIDYHT